MRSSPVPLASGLFSVPLSLPCSLVSETGTGSFVSFPFVPVLLLSDIPFVWLLLVSVMGMTEL
jgi:hypothetical protein